VFDAVCRHAAPHDRIGRKSGRWSALLLIVITDGRLTALAQLVVQPKQ
jgi:hypothetical protein